MREPSSAELHFKKKTKKKQKLYIIVLKAFKLLAVLLCPELDLWVICFAYRSALRRVEHVTGI